MENIERKLLIDNISYFNIGKGFTQSKPGADGGIYLTGVLQRAEVPNQNRRIYPRTILEREVDRLLPLIKDNQIVGELDHPQSDVVEFDSASHKLVDLWWEGQDLWGRVRILKNHPSGIKVLAALEEEVKIGISSRALGTTSPASDYPEYRQYEGCEVVNEDLLLITWDIVTNPSTHGAFLVTESMMTERTNRRLLETAPVQQLSPLDTNLIYFINKYGKN